MEKNNIQEQWEQWIPAENLSSEYFIESIIDHKKKLEIILCDSQNPEKKLFIIFEDFIGAYKWTDESFKLETFYFLSNVYGKFFFSKWSFFKVFNSPFLDIISKKFLAYAKSQHFLHFSIFEPDGVLDIISLTEPKIKVAK